MSSSDSNGVRQWGLNVWRAGERRLDAVFGAAHNPLRQLGTIGFLALWLLVASGLTLYVVFDTSVEGAWRSVDALARWPLGSGRLLRGLHHYAADLLATVVLLHIVRELLHGHWRAARRFHWLTGLPLVAFCFASAIGGFWLPWDQLAQYSAQATAEWLDALPLLATPLARNFLSNQAVGNRLFSLFVFVHVGVPLLLLFGLWFHVQRLAHVAWLPPRRLTLALVVMLVLLALLQPVASHPPADLARVPEQLRLDWLLLWLHPLAEATSRGFAWILLLGGALLLLALPFLARRAQAPAALVDPDNCSGCTWCVADCPYAAIIMVPHPGRRAGHLLAQVDPDLCTRCGICAGACPSSTPFRSSHPLVTGIDLPQRSVDALRNELDAALAASQAVRPLVLFSCEHGAGAPDLPADACQLPLLCAGQLPPSFAEYALSRGAAGVLVAACPEGGCEFRLGPRWTQQRFSRQRPPMARSTATSGRLQLVHAGPGESARLSHALQALRQQVAALPSMVKSQANEQEINARTDC
ncbi:MAG: cytochrome b N-terminal domain-containing protein [Ottowia sp.]|nr:hydrogenase iron-sulfur subunit [Ottowia sp.]